MKFVLAPRISSALEILMFAIVSAAQPALGLESEHSTLLPRVVSPIPFADGNFSGGVDKEKLEKLLVRPMKTGFSDEPDYKFLMKGKEQVHTENVAEFIREMEAGAQPQGIYSVTMAMHFVHAAGALEFIRRAKPANGSHLADSFLEALPVSILHWEDDEEKKRIDADAAAGKTLAIYHKEKNLDHWKTGGHSLRFQDESREYWIRWAAAGDVNGDGWEDRLISIYQSAIEGSACIFACYLVEKGPDVRSRMKLSPFLTKCSVFH